MNYAAESSPSVSSIPTRESLRNLPTHRASEAPPGVDRTTPGPFLAALAAVTTRFAERAALRIAVDGTWQELSYAALDEQARRVASWLMENGVVRGSTIALVSESRPEWVVALVACMMSGAVAVPIDPKLTPTEIGVLVRHSSPDVVLVSRAMGRALADMSSSIPSIRHMVAIDGDKSSPLSFATMNPSRLRTSRHRTNDDTALIVYTSGTTGDPKGVRTTFGNLLFETQGMDVAIGDLGRERFLSVLPLNHLYELICGLFTPLSRGATICYSESLLPDDVVRILREERITSLVGVPLLFRALRRGIERTVRTRGARTQGRFNRALAAARFVPSYAMRRVLFGEVLKNFGPDLRTFYSGGAALDPEVATFFERIGVPIYQGYGLSETSPVIATNTPQSNRTGSVGRPLRGVSVRVTKKNPSDTEGEIETKGPHVMAGYLRRDDLTREVLSGDGWLRTGDLGHLDADGFLFVTGRSKDLIVLGGGKKVHPDEVEEAMSRSPLFKEVCVVGAPGRTATTKGFDEVCVVVVPDDDIVRDAESAAALEESMATEVARVAEQIAQFKRPTRVVVRMGPLPKTATRKLKRPLVLQSLREGALGESLS